MRVHEFSNATSGSPIFIGHDKLQKIVAMHITTHENIHYCAYSIKEDLKDYVYHSYLRKEKVFLPGI